MNQKPYDDKTIKELEEMATDVRVSLIEMLAEAGSGHTAGPLDMTDIFVALYFFLMNIDPANPKMEDRDRLVLSNGHIVPVQYATMAHRGYFDVKELLTLRKFGSRLQGHPERERLPGLETTSGPLGSGLSQSAGMAYALRMDKKTSQVFCLLSDGELQAGNSWEGAMFAGKNRLSHLTAIVDRNNIQIGGPTEEVMPLEPLADKWKSFNWHVIEIDGHNMRHIIDAVYEAQAIAEKPVVIIAHTIAGKGVKEIEYDYRWHGVPPGTGPEDVVPKKLQKETFLKELRTLNGLVRPADLE